MTPANNSSSEKDIDRWLENAMHHPIITQALKAKMVFIIEVKHSKGHENNLLLDIIVIANGEICPCIFFVPSYSIE